jgi:hypothetical protein
MGRKKIDRTGEESYNNFGTLMKIVKYKDANNMIVEFQDSRKARIHTQYGHFKKGKVKNPYDKEVFGVGYLGVGKYTARGKDKKLTNAYISWENMLKRCYDPYYINRFPTYKDCYVCDEWLCFQNFAKWYYENYYEIENQKMCLDKDILYKGNKIYSPETCVFVPERINTLFIKSDKVRGEYPIGTCLTSDNSALRVRCSIFENGKTKRIYLGQFSLNKPFQAFYTYKTFKENHIKQVADEYKDLIPERLYKAMYGWIVEIND